MQRFSATMDAVAKTITYALIVVILIPFYTIGRIYAETNDTRLFIVPVLVVLALLLAYLYRPQAYGLDQTKLHIFRTIKPLAIPVKTIRSIMPITSKEMGLGLSATVIGGFFGYFGKYIFQKQGSAWMYVTDRSRMLLITLADESQIVISPDDTQGFMKAFHEIMRRK